MEYIINNDELAHYGVPGMKWGVRKANNGASSGYIRNLRRKYGNAIRYNKKNKRYEIDKYSNDYKKAKKSTIKKATIGAAAGAVIGTGAYLYRKKKIGENNINLTKGGKEYATYNTITRRLQINGNPMRAKLTRKEGKALVEAIFSSEIEEYKKLTGFKIK